MQLEFLSRLQSIELPCLPTGKFWSICFHDITPDEVAAARSFLDQQILHRISRQKMVADQFRLILIHASLRFLLSNFLDCDPDALFFSQTQFGKPYLEWFPCHFNISHSHDFGFIGIHPEQALGVDVEKIHDIEEITSLFLTPSELALDMPIVLWCAKEAILKCIGTGFLMEPLPILEKKREGFFMAHGIQVHTFKAVNHCFAVAFKPDLVEKGLYVS